MTPLAALEEIKSLLTSLSSRSDESVPCSLIDEALALIPIVEEGLPVWRDISTDPDGKEMFVVCAFNVCNGFTGGKPYTSDPYCVWKELDGSFARWNHKFPPTHWMPLPIPPKQPEEEV